MSAPVTTPAEPMHIVITGGTIDQRRDMAVTLGRLNGFMPASVCVGKWTVTVRLIEWDGEDGA